MKNILPVFVTLNLIVINTLAQGPPITADKPIMLGAKRVIIKSLTEIRTTDQGIFTKAPLMVHYLPISSLLFAIHIPYVNLAFSESLIQAPKNFSGLGDVELLGKYQFYRKDATGKTFRMLAKTLQTLPTGKAYNLDGILTGTYQSYVGVVAGYESIKYGISNELGVNMSGNSSLREFKHKLGFGLPLLKPSYPVKQVNLYFEYQNSWFYNTGGYRLLYAQGLQYAIKRLTVEAAIQFPLIQDNTIQNFKRSVLVGTRYVF